MSTKPYLDRRELSEFLTGLGFRVARSTLAKYATLGGGPVMRKFGRRVLYDPAAAIDWANVKLSPPRRSTSDVEGTSRPLAIDSPPPPETESPAPSSCDHGLPTVPGRGVSK